jgi:hypothetical protein
MIKAKISRLLDRAEDPAETLDLLFVGGQLILLAFQLGGPSCASWSLSATPRT